MNEFDLMKLLQLPTGQPETPLMLQGVQQGQMPVTRSRVSASMPVNPQAVGSPILAITNPKVPITDSVFKQLIERQTKGLEDQRAGIGSLEEQFKQFQGQQANPYAAVVHGLSDMFNKTNNLPAFMQQQQVQQNNAMDMAAKIQAAKMGVTDKEIELLRAQYQNEQDSAMMRLQRELGFAKLDGKGQTTPKDILRTKESQRIQAQIGLKDSLEAYEKLLDEKGIELYGKGVDALEAAYADLKIKYKEAANLGALTGPDVALLVEAVKPATGVGGAFRGATSSVGLSDGVPGIKAGVQQLRQNLANDYNVQQDTLETAFGSEAPILKQYRQKFETNRSGAQASPATAPPAAPNQDPGFLAWKKSKGL